jgi:type I restriction enzyme S subunit
MSNWTKQKLGNIFKLEYGKGLVSDKRVSGSFPVYGSSGIVGTHNESLIKGPGIVVGRKGSVGEIYFSDKDFYPIDTVYYIANNESKYNIKYLYYFLKSINLKKLQGDVGVPGLNRETVHAEEVLFLNDKVAQNNIASVITAYDDLIENNEKRIKALEEMAQLLYTEWFVKFKFPGHEKIKLVDSGTSYGKIPEGWEVKKLDKLISPQYGYTASAITDPCLPKYLRGTDINKNSYINWSQVPNCKISDEELIKYKVLSKDIFIIRMADPGKIGICERKINAVFASYLMRLNIKEKLTPYYLFYFLNSDRYQKFILGASNGATRKSINSHHVGMIDVIIPSSSILEKFEAKISHLREKISNLLMINEVLSKTRDLLIPQLVTGKRELKNI